MTPLVAEQFQNDPRVADAKRLIAEALVEHQQKLVAPCEADPARKQSYEDTLKQFGDVRGGNLFYPYLASGIGNGALVELADGSVKFDMITGIGVHYFGHSHAAIVDAAVTAGFSDTIMQGNLQQNLPSAKLAQTLVTQANKNGAQLEHCFLTTSGAMANENAFKIMMQKRFPASRILAFRGCFMGRSLAMAQVTDRAKYREGLPTILHVDYVPPFDPENPKHSTEKAVGVLKRHLSRYPDQHALMAMELVIGEGGYYPGDRDFFLALINILREHGVPVLFDEIQTFGRTTELFAFQHYRLDEFADVVTLGKNSQVCATLFRDEFKPKPGLVSQTFTGATASIAAAQVIIDELVSGDFFGTDGRIMQVHQRFVDNFNAIMKRNPALLCGPFGIGAMIAITPLVGSFEKAKATIHALYDAGVISFIAGSDPARVRFLPPVGVITDEQIDAVCVILEKTLTSLA